MIDHVWSVLCHEAEIDKSTNKVSLHSVVEQVQVNSAPVPGGILPIRLNLVSLWIRRASDHPVIGSSRINFISPSGKIMTLSEPGIDLSKTERARHVVQIEGIPLGESGRYHFQVELKYSDEEWLQVASIPLSVSFSPPESSQDEVIAKSESS